MNLTSQLPLIRAIPGRSQPLLHQRRTVVASSNRLLISSLTQLFDGIGPLVGAATSQDAALECLGVGGVELLICTDQLDTGDGPALVAAAKQRHPRTRCLMLIQRPLLSTVLAALAAGCEGLCSGERLGRGGLLEVLQAMESGGIHLDPLISGVLQRGQNGGAADNCGRLATPQQPSLSLREEDLLRSLCNGLNNQAIAAELHLSINTVKHGITNLLRKFDANDRTQLVLLAFQRGLMDPPQPSPRW